MVAVAVALVVGFLVEEGAEQMASQAKEMAGQLAALVGGAEGAADGEELKDTFSAFSEILKIFYLKVKMSGIERITRFDSGIHWIDRCYYSLRGGFGLSTHSLFFFNVF